MDETRFLLTYTDADQGEDTYAWFTSEDEMKEFVSSQRNHDRGFYVYEAQEIIKARPIEV
jgi:hypothetical protein